MSVKEECTCWVYSMFDLDEVYVCLVEKSGSFIRRVANSICPRTADQIRQKYLNRSGTDGSPKLHCGTIR